MLFLNNDFSLNRKADHASHFALVAGNVRFTLMAHFRQALWA